MPHRRVLGPLLKEAYNYWLKNEEPYPVGIGVIPESPRGEILELGIEQAVFSYDELFSAASDRRDDVSKPANKALLSAMSTSDAVRGDFCRRLQRGEALDGLLTASLRDRIAFSEHEIRSIAGLLESASRTTRYAASGVLELHYLSLDTILQLSERLTADSHQQLRDKGYERLTALKP